MFEGRSLQMLEVEEDRSMSAFHMTLGFYICAQLGIAIVSMMQKNQRVAEEERRKKKAAEKAENGEEVDMDTEFNQHFAGGKSFGCFATFLTFFSTAYSGYTVSGIPREAMGMGFFSMWWMIAYNVANGGSLIWKPRVRRLSVVRKWMSYQDPLMDRFNNRLLTLLVTCFACAGQVCYTVIQFYSMRNLIDTISPEKDDIDAEAVTWVLCLAILFAEVTGGMGAVVLTDSIQSFIMISSMIMMPILMTVHYGGVANCVRHDCDNLETINCTEGTWLYRRNAMCRGRVQMNGCLGQPSVAPWLTLHPSVGLSEYWKPRWATPDGNLWPEYPCPDDNTTMCRNPLRGEEVTRGSRSFDGSWIFNFSNFWFGQMAFRFLSIPFMPNHMSRFFTASSDANLKKATIAQVLLGGAIATFPAVLMGVMIAANLRRKFPSGSDAFGMMVADFNNRGGFNQFVGVTASVAAIAAFMSTADSCIISITGMLTRELLQNGIFQLYPHLKSTLVFKIFAVTCSTCTLFVATCVALYDPDINDPEGMAFTLIGGYQSFFLSFGAMAYCAMLFCPNASDWAIFIGMFVALSLYLILHIGEWGDRVQTVSFTSFADFEPKHILFQDYTWAMIVNFIVTMLLCQIPFNKWFPTPNILKINTTVFDPDGQPLRYEQIKEAMVGTGEIWKDPIGLGCIIWIFTTCIIAIPQFGSSYEGCNYRSYSAWFNAGADEEVDGCPGSRMCGGIPCFAVPAFVIFPTNKLLIAFAYSRWKTVDPKEEEDTPETPSDNTNLKDAVAFDSLDSKEDQIKAIANSDKDVQTPKSATTLSV